MIRIDIDGTVETDRTVMAFFVMVMTNHLEKTEIATIGIVKEADIVKTEIVKEAGIGKTEIVKTEVMVTSGALVKIETVEIKIERIECSRIMIIVTIDTGITKIVITKIVVHESLVKNLAKASRRPKILTNCRRQ